LVAETVFTERASFWPQTGDNNLEDGDPDFKIFWQELFGTMER
jgi:hypothetical protein